MIAPVAMCPEPLLVDSDEAARLLDVCPKTIFNMTKAGELPVVRRGRSVRYSVATLRKWIEANESTETAAVEAPASNGTETVPSQALETPTADRG